MLLICPKRQLQRDANSTRAVTQLGRDFIHIWGEMGAVGWRLETTANWWRPPGAREGPDRSSSASSPHGLGSVREHGAELVQARGAEAAGDANQARPSAAGGRSGVSGERGGGLSAAIDDGMRRR
jgi:hypothetical protein